MHSISADVVRDLAPTGRVRATINLGNTVLAQQNKSGNLGGVSVEIARELARRLGTEIELHPFDTAGKAFTALSSGVCDVGFLAIDQTRAEMLDYTAPYVIIEGTYLVRDESAIHEITDADRSEFRIAAGKNTAYDLYLSRSLRLAKLVHYPSSAAAIEGLLNGQTEAAAGVRQPLTAVAAANHGFRVLPGCFQTIKQAMALPKDHVAGLAYLHALIEELKASGFVAAALNRSGQGDATVAGSES